METCSGLTLDRPRLCQLRQCVRGKGADTVIAYTLDRLSRDPVHFIILQDGLEKARCVAVILVTHESLFCHYEAYTLSSLRGTKYRSNLL